VNPIPPIAQYDHTLGFAVTGGYVYRGKAVPSLVGRYIFGDFATGRIWDIPTNTPPTKTMTGGFESGLLISSFAQDNDGEVYVVSIRGDLHRITGASAGGGGPGVATKLSETGCVSSADPKRPASGLIPYTPNASFWSDGAAKERWIALPDGQNISVGDDGDWDFPNGTVLMKNFRLANRLIETRLFMRHPDGIWAGYSYEWDAQGTDATLVPDGKQRNAWSAIRKRRAPHWASRPGSSRRPSRIRRPVVTRTSSSRSIRSTCCRRRSPIHRTRRHTPIRLARPARLPSERAPTCTPTARSAIVRVGRRRPTWTCVSPLHSRIRTPATLRRLSAISASQTHGSSHRAPPSAR
jgi:hypothetical protein